MPIIFSGTDCRLKEKLNIEMDPLFKNEASAMIDMSAMLLKASPRVRGKEAIATCFISLKLIEKENFGENPQCLEAKA